MDINTDLKSKVFEIVKKYVDDIDYYKLLAGGAPDDEFDIESKKIANIISYTDSPEAIATVIADVFNKSFEDNNDSECFMETANKIYNELNML